MDNNIILILNIEQMNIIAYTIKIFIISILSLLICIKITNTNIEIKKILVAILTLFFSALATGVVKYYSNSYMSIITHIILISIIYSLIAKRKIGYSIIATTISYSINYISLFLSLIISFFIEAFHFIDNDYINMIIIFLIDILILYSFFRIRKFKYGFSFLQNNLDNDILDILILNISVVILLAFITFTDPSLLRNTLFFTFIIFSFIMFFTIKKLLSIYYKQKLLKQNIEYTNNQLINKNEQLNQLEQENIRFSKISHSISHRQKMLEFKLKQLETLLSDDQIKKLNSDITFISTQQNELGKLNTIQNTNIPELDDMFSYLKSECNKYNINFYLICKGNFLNLVNNYINKDSLSILIADLIKNAIISINNNSNPNRSIMVIIGFIDNCYKLCVYDTGKEFDIIAFDKLGKEAYTTHSDSGGTGYGFMNIFDIIRFCKASLIVCEKGKPNKNDYTKYISVEFNSLNKRNIYTYRFSKLSLSADSEFKVFPLEK